MLANTEWTVRIVSVGVAPADAGRGVRGRDDGTATRFYSSKEGEPFYNEYSVMPNMDFAWRTLYGVMFSRGRHRRAQTAALAYPAMIFVAVVVTVNHYFVDSLMGGLEVVASFHLRRRVFGEEWPLVRRLVRGPHAA